MKTPMPHRHVSTVTAGMMLGIDYSTIRDWCREGKVQAVRVPAPHTLYAYAIPRHEVTRLRQELRVDEVEVVSYEDAAEMLCIGMAQVERLVSQRRLERVGPPGSRVRQVTARSVEAWRDYLECPADCVSLDEAGRRLGMKASAVRKYVSRGELTVVRRSKWAYVTRESLEALAQKRGRA